MLDPKLQEELIHENRRFIKGYRSDDPYMEAFESDQSRALPQPPLTKAAVTEPAQQIALPRDFSALPLTADLTAVFRDRRSHRVFTEQPMSLTELSYLLWATQGVQQIRGQNYATIRPVPCGGARHEFETYLLVRQVDGLEQGVYHYLPMEHRLELLRPVADVPALISALLCEQVWAAKANVVFLWSIVPYRAEWRYGIYAHRIALVDAGHLGQNLYLACTGLGLGACGIGAFEDALCSEALGLDGEEEFVIYTAPAGTIPQQTEKPMFL